MSTLPRRKMGRTGMQPRALGMGAAFVNHVDEASCTGIDTAQINLDLPGTQVGCRTPGKQRVLSPREVVDNRSKKLERFFSVSIRKHSLSSVVMLFSILAGRLNNPPVGSRTHNEPRDCQKTDNQRTYRCA